MRAFKMHKILICFLAQIYLIVTRKKIVIMNDSLTQSLQRFRQLK